MTDVVLVLTTVGDESASETIARTLVEERLAACVNVHAPMVSFYRWKGTVERDGERQLAIKTTRARLPELRARVQALHPYQLPELIVLAADDGSAEYLDWVRTETEPA